MCCGDNYDDDFLDEIEKSGDGPLVVFPYGFRQIEVKGKSYLHPLTIDDFISSYARLKNMQESQVKSDLENGLLDVCGITSYGFCVKPKDCKSCQLQTEYGNRYCTCVWYKK